MIHDFCVIGAGIVGLATAMDLLRRRPGASLIVLEKEDDVAVHQTGHNSGVIHAGVYYTPGSLKAQLCRQGCDATKEFCLEHDIRFEQCGKLLVATDGKELARLAALQERAAANGIVVERLCAAALREREPNVAGLGALFVPATGIVDYREICRAMRRKVEAAGGTVRFAVTVSTMRETSSEVAVSCGENGEVRARKLVACAGLQSDRLAARAGLSIEHRIVPFRGEYFVLPPSRNEVVRHLIYPVPNPDLPFLGIHLTRLIDGRVTVGPNAVLGLAREGYPKGSVSLRDTGDILTFPGFWKFLRANWRPGLTELSNSVLRSAYLKECRKYCPSLNFDDLRPHPAGIRAQAVMADGSLVHDFLFVRTERMLHVCNAPSSAATSAIPIGQIIAESILHDPENAQNSTRR